MKTDLEGAEELFVHCHHAPCVVIVSTVVGCREESDQLPPGKELIPVFHHL